MSAPLDRTVMWLTWRQLFARRRIWMAVAFALTPCLLAVLFQLLADDTDAARKAFFANLGREIVLGTILPVAAMIFATTALGGEVDDGTLVYLLVKPIARWRIVLSKYVVALVSTLIVSFFAIALPWLVLRGPELPGRTAGALLAGAAVASVAYCAVFLATGLITKRALVVSLLYIILVEEVASRSLAGLQSVSIRQLAISLTQRVSDGTLPPLPTVVATISTIAWAGSIIVVAAMALTMWRLSGYELAERL